MYGLGVERAPGRTWSSRLEESTGGIQESLRVGVEQPASILATVGGIREAAEAKVGKGAWCQPWVA